MDFVWKDYASTTMEFVESWLDAETVRLTGLEDGFRDFYDYWAAEDGYCVGKNYWCKVAYEADTPVGIIAFALHEGNMSIMEILVAPEKRGQGSGTKMLAELHSRPEILGFQIEKSEAVIFPDNIASQRAFEKAGFHHHHTYEDGSALIYVYEQKKPSC